MYFCGHTKMPEYMRRDLQEPFDDLLRIPTGFEERGHERQRLHVTPGHDADGNQTLIQTETGIWCVAYNVQSRAVRFENESSGTMITCDYDYLGQRGFKKMEKDGAVTLHERYIYRGYLQIAAYDLREGHAEHPDLRFIIWDPTQEVATRPLAIRENGVWYTYGWDLTKNICELYGQEGFIRTIYTYLTMCVEWLSPLHTPSLMCKLKLRNFYVFYYVARD